MIYYKVITITMPKVSCMNALCSVRRYRRNGLLMVLTAIRLCTDCAVKVWGFVCLCACSWIKYIILKKRGGGETDTKATRFQNKTKTVTNKRNGFYFNENVAISQHASTYSMARTKNTCLNCWWSTPLLDSFVLLQIQDYLEFLHSKQRQMDKDIFFISSRYSLEQSPSNC